MSTDPFGDSQRLTSFRSLSQNAGVAAGNLNFGTNLADHHPFITRTRPTISICFDRLKELLQHEFTINNLLEYNRRRNEDSTYINFDTSVQIGTPLTNPLNQKELEMLRNGSPDSKFYQWLLRVVQREIEFIQAILLRSYFQVNALTATEASFSSPGTLLPEDKVDDDPTRTKYP